MASGLAVFLVLAAAYAAAVVVLRHQGRLGPDRPFSLMGPILMLRTEWGKALLDRLARARRFWLVLGDAGILAAAFFGAVFIVVLVWQFFFVLAHADVLSEDPPGVRDALALPVVNPIIPLGYGILGLVLALVIHEGAHGVLARASEMRVKSLGLLFLIVPIGAFVEPDERDLRGSALRKQNRVFAAGPMSNLVLALLSGLLFSAGFMGATVVAHGAEGVGVGVVHEGYAADAAGVPEGAVIVGIDGVAVRTYDDFNRSMSRTVPGERVTLTLYHRGTERDAEVVLGSKHDFYAKEAPDLNRDEYRGQGFLGVATVPLDVVAGWRDGFRHPFGDGILSFAFYLSLPFLGLQPLDDPLTGFLEPAGAAAGMDPGLFFVLANAAYWVFWLNFLVGTFNALPLAFLDGGQMFRANLHALVSRRMGLAPGDVALEKAEEGDHVVLRGRDAAAQARLDRVESVVRRVTTGLGVFLLFLILAPFVGPRVLA